MESYKKLKTIINSIVILILLLLLSGGSCPTKTSKKQSDGYSKKVVDTIIKVS